MCDSRHVVGGTCEDIGGLKLARIPESGLTTLSRQTVSGGGVAGILAPLFVVLFVDAAMMNRCCGEC